MRQTPRIVILGPQGAGKGTQAGRLKHRLHIPHISMGDEIRSEVARGTIQGKRLARIINRGNLIPDSEATLIARKRLRQPDTHPGWIMDGYPRSMHQVPPFQKFGQPNIVLYLHFLDRQAVRRLSGRRVCPKGHIYHIRHDPPKKYPGYCDHDGLKLRQRDDDTPTAIRKRLKIFHHTTEPVIHWYRHRGLLIEVDAGHSIAVVYRKILTKLKRIAWLSSRLAAK